MEAFESYGSRLKRIAILPAAVLIQTCLGGVYAWSSFVPSLQKDYAFSASWTQSIFGLTIASFTVAMVFAGRLVTRWGPRWVALAGALLFFSGYLISAAFDGRLLWLLGGYGVVGGAGIGFGYLAALTSAVQWFPKHKGVVTGVAVAGFGFGAVLLAGTTTTWARSGWTVPEMFHAIGWMYGTAVAVAAFFLFRPPSACTGGAPSFGAGMQFLKSRAFRVLAPGLFCGTFAGLLVIGLLKPIGLNGGLSSEYAASAIGGLAVGNVAGRIVWGWLFDRMGYRTIPASLIFLCLALIALPAARFSPIPFVAVSGLVGFGFSACFVLYAAQVAVCYGAQQVGNLYPILFLSYGAAGITGPQLGGLLSDWSGGYTQPIAVAALVAAVGTWLTIRGAELFSGAKGHAAVDVAFGTTLADGKIE